MKFTSAIDIAGWATRITNGL